MEDALTKEGKARSAIPHPFQQFELVNLSLNDSIVLRQGEAVFDRGLVSLDTHYKAPQFGDLALFGFGKPRLKLLPRARTQYLGKLGHEGRSQFHFRMALAKLEKRLLFLLVHVFISPQEQEGRLSWGKRRWSLLGSL